MPDMDTILGRMASEVKPPMQVPVGDWIMRVTGYGTTKSDPQRWPKSSTGNDQVGFDLLVEVPIEIPDDFLVDFQLPHKWRTSFWLTDEALWRLTDFLSRVLKIDPNQPILDQLPHSQGKLFRGTVTQRMDKGPRQPGETPKMYSQISAFYPMD
jgi:hypothetical protein